jgi:cyclase
VTDDLIVLHAGEIDNMVVVREVGGNMTAIRTDSGVVVTDSFVSPQAGREARYLIEAHFPNVPIKYLINTHHHSDHIRGNQYFRDAVIVAHVNLEKHLLDDYDRLIEKYGNYNEKIVELKERIKEVQDGTTEQGKKLKEDLAYWEDVKAFLEQYIPTPPSFQITSNAILKLGDTTFEILYFGTAHTNNDLVVLDRDDKLLIMGDLLFYRKCYIMNPKSDPANWISLLNKLIERSDEYEYVIPGHGGVVLTVDALKEQRDYLKNLCDAVKGARQSDLNLDLAKKEIRLEQYKKYIDYDRIGLDIEACWQQLEK